eukprot:628573-Pelagomonas_calceolata.AAC.3
MHSEYNDAASLPADSAVLGYSQTCLGRGDQHGIDAPVGPLKAQRIFYIYERDLAIIFGSAASEKQAGTQLRGSASGIRAKQSIV